MLKQIVTILIVAGLATGFSYVAGLKSRESLGFKLFWLLTAYSFAVQIVAFVIAEILHTELFFDLTGSLTYISISLIATLTQKEQTFQQWIATGMVIAWALRLGFFLFIRILKRGEDSRFAEIKESKLRFFTVWFIQGLWVIITMSPLLVIMTDYSQMSSSGTLLWLEILGLAIWALGLVTETVADIQKYSFSSIAENKGKFITEGLWSVSRHPNYAGEILVWIGAAIFAGSSLKDEQFISLISPLFVIILIWKVSGVNLLEEKGDKRWGEDSAYQKYKKNTSVLFPLPKCQAEEPQDNLV